jgi:hypothetical protein
MLAGKKINFLGILSGLYGIVSLLLPWGIAELRGYVQPMSLWSEGWFYFENTYVQAPLPYYTLTHISAILAITIAIMIMGCFTAFLGSLTTGRRERLLMFSAGTSFSLAPIIFLLSLTLLFSGFGRFFFGSTAGYSSSVSSGFIMAFVAAVPAFLSLGNLRRIKLFLLVWALISAGWIGFWTIVYGLNPSVPYYHERMSALIIGSPIFSLELTSISTLVYGIYLVLKKK